MLKWKIMTSLLVLLCNFIIFDTTVFVINCKCEKHIDYEDYVETKTYQIDQNTFFSTETSAISTNNLHPTLKLEDSSLKTTELLNETNSEITTEINIPFPTHPEPDPPAVVPFSQKDNPEPHPPPLLLCSEVQETVLNTNISWPITEKDEEAISRPLCLDKSLIIMKRRCEDKEQWSPAPNCATLQEHITNPCAPGLSPFLEKYCYTKISKTTFPPKCPYVETVGWDEYIQLNLIDYPIWMPVTRQNESDYGTDVMRFTEFTENYQVPYGICTQSCRTFFYSGSFLDKLCQIYHNSTHIEAVKCDQEYSAVCVYHALPQRTKSFCSQVHPGIGCKQSGYGTDSPCFCEAPNNNQIGPSALVDLQFQYQNLIYTNINKACHFGLTKSENTSLSFIWSASNQSIKYSNWSPKVDINFDNTFGVITSDGWILESENVHDCVLYQIPATQDMGTLQLEIVKTEDYLFQLTIKNYRSFLSNDLGEPLVYCFTDADATSLIYRIHNFSKTISNDIYIYKFSQLTIPQSGPGNYWCEGFLYPNLEIIKTETINLTHFEAEYVVILKLKQYEEKLSSYPLKAENFATLQNLFKNELKNPMSFFPRIFKLNEIDEDKKELTITFHLSSSEATNTEEVFKALKASSMAQTIFEFVDFRSVNYCPSIQTRQFDGLNITWPRAILEEKKNPENGFCVTDNVDLIQKTCLGDFINGAYWSETTQHCTFYPSSSLTDNLIKITRCNESCDSALNDLLDVTENYSSFNTLDLVLTVKFLETIADQNPNLETFSGIINNLMQISRPVLLSSQYNFKATDLLLLSLDKALEHGDFDEYRTENFAIKSIDVKNNGIYGIFLQNCPASFTNCDLVQITNLTHLVNESYILTNNVVAAIAISQNLYNQINHYSEVNSSYIPKLKVSIYYGSQLFIEPNAQKLSNYVFGVLLPGFTEDFSGPLSIYYYKNDQNNYLGYNCSYWDFNEPTYSLWADEGTENTNMNQAVYCEFYHITNFGIPTTLVDEYCDASQNSEKTLDCLDNKNKVDTYANKSLVKYQGLCGHQVKHIKEYEDEFYLISDTVFCTIFVIDGNTHLSKFCYIGDGTAISTNCFENFDEESHYFNITEHCTNLSYSNLLKELHDTANIAEDNCWTTVLDLMFIYSENYNNFSDLDVLVIAAVLNPIAYSKPDLQVVAGIVNNLMKIPREILDSAQRNFRAMDILLHNIEKTLKDGDCNEWKTENFAIKCLDVREKVIGFIVNNCTKNFTDCNFSPVSFADNIYNASYDTLYQKQASIFFSEPLYNQIVTYYSKNSSYSPRMIVSLYSGPQLFVELDASAFKRDVFSFVFGILLPDFSEKFEGPILIYYFNNTSENLVEYNCSYWKYDDANYGSWMTESLEANKTVAICEFYHVTNFAMPIKFLNYSQLKSSPKNELGRLDSKNVCMLNHKDTLNGLFLNKNNMSKIKKDQLGKFKSRSFLNNFLVNILGKMDIYGESYFPIFNREDFLDSLGFSFSTSDNKQLPAPSAKKSVFKQSVNFINRIPKLFIEYFNFGIKNLEILDEANTNITHKLNVISTKLTCNNLDETFAKLEQLLLKHSFNDFNVTHIQTFARVLQNTKLQTNFNSLEKLSNILNLMVNIQRDKIIEAQTKFQSTDIILYAIDNILRGFKTNIQIQKEHLLFLIISQEDVSTFFGFYITKNKEVVFIRNKDEENEFKDVEMDTRVIISTQLHNQIKTNKTRMIFVIFYNDIYFPDKKEHKVIKPIVEVLFPDLKDGLKGNFEIAYKFDGLNHFTKCSYWDHVVTMNKVVKLGSWKNELPPQLNGTWAICTFNHATHFALVTSSKNITTDLEYILNSNLTGLEKLKQVDVITHKSHANLLPVDIFLISQILGNSLTEGAAAYVTSQIISNLFNVPPNILRESQQLHTATDIILHNVDKMADMLEDTFISFNNFSLIVKDLNTVNLTGILLRSCNESKCTIDQLDSFINISDYSKDEDMSALVVFSQELVAQIRNLTINTKVIISIYYSNVLFNEIGNERNTTKVFGVVFPGLNASLDGKVSVIYNIRSKISDRHQCAYWYYKVNPDGNVDNATFGQWKNDSEKNRLGQVAICNYSHVTHFAMLLSNNNNYNDSTTLKIITYIGCILSLLGILIIIFTAMLFKKWRQNTGNKILINFSIAISLKIAMLYISEYVKSTSSSITCTILGIILHYAILSECAWMLTIAILQFKRFVEVLGGPPKYILVKALICGWFFPAIPVICVLAIDPDNYLEGHAGLCYPSNLGLYLGVWLPVIIIVSINCVIFIFIIYNVFHKKTEYIDCANYDILFQWRLALLLFFMLGLTWLFGFLGEINGDALFVYVFCITASMQGFVLFLFFIVFNKSSRVLYSHSAKQWINSRGIFKLWQTKTENKF